MSSARAVIRYLATGLVAVVLATLGFAPSALAGPDTTLCKSNTTRGAVPDKFPLRACFDGTTLVVINNLDFPVVVSVAGGSQPQRVPKLQGAMSSHILSILEPGNSGMAPPGYQIKVSIGAGEAKVSLSSSQGLAKKYAVTKLVWDFLPLAEAGKAAVEMIRELVDVGDQYLRCLQTNNNWGDIGCKALQVRNVGFAVSRAGITAVVTGLAGALMSLAELALWTDDIVGEALKAQKSVSSFTLKAAPAAAQPPAANPPAGTNPQPGGGNPPPAGNPPPGGNQPPAAQNPQPPPPATRNITIQNKYLVGATGMAEDAIPAYLSARMEPRCRVNGCMLGGTEMGSGDTLTVTCYAHGTPMTNENRSRADDDANPNRVDSSLWYRGTRAGQTGYLSEVYIIPQHRGGLGLPRC